MASKPIVYDRFGGLGTRWKPESVPAPLLVESRNCRLGGGQVSIRPGLTVALRSPEDTQPLRGLGTFLDLSGKRLIVALDAAGNIFATNPYPGEDVGSVIVAGASIVTVTPNGDRLELSAVDFPIDPDAYMDTAAAYGRIFMVFSDNVTGTNGPRQLYWNTTLDKYRYAGFGMPSATGQSSSSQSVTAGDVQEGVRYFITIFETETGYQTGYTISAINTHDQTDPDLSIDLVDIPVSPNTNVVRRIIAFTQAGASSSGPYFYLPEDAFIEGLNHPVDGDGNNITKTVIEDNVSTTATVSFPDEYLLGGVDVTGFLDKLDLPYPKSIYYSRTLKRIVTCGEDDSTFRFSEIDDPETFYGTTGLNRPGEGDEGVAMCAREFRGELYLLKNNGGYLAADTSLSPAEWNVPRRWEGVGPCGPWAADVCNEFLAIADESGPYIYRGDAPEAIGYEITENPETLVNWARINKDYFHLVYVAVDQENHLVRFGVPLGESTQVNAEFICDYSEGWAKRKWNYDDVANVRAMKRKTQDLGTAYLIASNGPDGYVFYEDPTNRTLNGSQITQELKLAYLPGLNNPGVNQFDYAELTIGGSGNAGIILCGNANVSPVNLADAALDGTVQDYTRAGIIADNQRFSIKVTNKSELGNWFELQRVTMWLTAKWKRGLL